MKIPKTISLKTALIIVALTTLLIASTFYALAVNPSTTIYIAGGKYPGGISFTIWREGSNYFAKNAYGQIHADSGTNISELTDNLIVASTYEILFTGGTYAFDSTVVVDYPIIIRGEGNQTILQLNANVNLFNVTSNNVRFYDFWADGNSQQGHGFYGDGVINCRWENLRIRAFRGAGIYLSLPTGGNCWMIGNRITSCDYAIFLASVSDCYIIGNDLGATTYNVIQLGGAHHLVEGNRIYMAGYNWSGDLAYHAYRGIDVYLAHYMTIIGNQIVSNGGDGILLNGANYTTIDGNYFNENDRANANRAGLRLYGDSSFNDVVGNTFNNVGGSASQNYGVLEESGDYNNIVGCNAWNQITIGILISGANTEVMSSWNGTTYISGAAGATGPTGPSGTLEGEQPYSYLVFQNATATYAINGITGDIDYSDTDAEAVINDADDNMPSDGGLLLLNPATYNLDSAITLGKRTRLKGQGAHNTILNVTANVNAIEIDTSDTEFNWAIQDLQIDMNQKNGNGITSNHATSYAAKGMCEIHRVRIDNVAFGYDGVYLEDIGKFDAEELIVRTYGDGIVLTVDGATPFNFGDSEMRNIKIRLLGSNAVGMKIIGETPLDDQAFNLALISTLWIYSTAGDASTIGLLINETQHLQFDSASIEQCGIAVYFYRSRDITFVQPYIMSTVTGSVGFDIEGTSGAIRTYGGTMTTDGMEWDDDSSWRQNLMHSLLIKTPTVDVSNTDIAYSYDMDTGTPIS